MKAHTYFNKNQKTKAKVKHQNFKKNHPEAYKRKQDRLIAKLVDMYTGTRYPNYQLKVTLLVR